MENNLKILEIDTVLTRSLARLDVYLNNSFISIIEASNKNRNSYYRGDFLSNSIMKLPINISSKQRLIHIYVNTSRSVRKIFL